MLFLKQKHNMKQTRLLMGMPITLEVVDATVTQDDLDKVFAYFVLVDETFSTDKTTSEISKINRGELLAAQYSEDMKTILALAAQTKKRRMDISISSAMVPMTPQGLSKGGPSTWPQTCSKRGGFRISMSMLAEISR